MKSVFAILLLTVGIVFNADASIWKWVDSNGDTHFVDSNRPIYTWVDDYGKLHYSDKPDHEDAISVQLVWVSSALLDEMTDEKDEPGEGAYAHPGESAEERAEREAAEEYYCKRTTEIYDSYVNAPQLYRTNDAGEREYLSDREAAAMIGETKTRMDDICD